MPTLTIDPPEDIDTLPLEFRQKWHDALQTSVKKKNEMCSPDDTAHCCLCVAARLEGATLNDYVDVGLPSDCDLDDNDLPLSQMAEDMYCLSRLGQLCFSQLNDGSKPGRKFYPELTHPQIAELVMGRSVTVEVPE